MTRYTGMLSNIGMTSVVHAPDVVEVRWDCLAGGRIFRRQATEYVLGSLVVLSRLLLPGRKDLPVAVNFSHARPDSPRHAREYVAFFQCPVYFERPVSSVLIPAAAVRAKLRHGDAFVKDLMERHAATLLRQRTVSASLADEVKHLVAAMILEGVPAKDAVAEQLGMSSRSLHRKLQEMGTSYRDLLDDVRLEIARERLHASGSAGEISDGLGFSNRQAFLRWFKQKTGKTPSEYRNDTQGQGASS
jgi:AraC-like DNA-binding protein